jgi:hypothetical protein
MDEAERSEAVEPQLNVKTVVIIQAYEMVIVYHYLEKMTFDKDVCHLLGMQHNLLSPSQPDGTRFIVLNIIA